MCENTKKLDLDLHRKLEAFRGQSKNLRFSERSDMIDMKITSLRDNSSGNFVKEKLEGRKIRSR